MSEPAQGVVQANGVQLYGWRWGDRDSGTPVAVLVHGTGFCAATWRAVAEGLADAFVVYAYDRRGHGRSTAPPTGYDLWDFALDLIGFVEALGLRDVYAIGHSSGGADVLIAASVRPERFSRIYVHEPPVHDPRGERDPGTGLDEEARVMLRDRRNRRAEFLSRDEVAARYASRPPFHRWRPDILREYVEHGCEEGRDGIVRLRCDPANESKMLEPLFLMRLNRYRGDERGDPFAPVPELALPVAVSTSELSEARYHAGAATLKQLVPGATHVVIPGAHHCAPQEQPEALAARIRAFAGL